METIKVYRYENNKGEGPYWQKFTDSLVEMYNKHNGDDYPGWLQDFEVKNNPDYISGCNSLESLDKWFDGYKELLNEAGYDIKTYLIPKENIEYGKSGKQLRFKI